MGASLRIWGLLALGLALSAGAVQAADFKTLRNLNAPPPIRLEPLANGVKTRPVQFAKAVMAPRDGEAWALAYYSLAIQDPDHPRDTYTFLNWNSGRVGGDPASFARIFNEEAAKAGFSTSAGDSLFGEGDSGGDLKIGVLIGDLKGW